MMHNSKDYMVSDEALNAVRQESARAIQKHKLANTVRPTDRLRLWKLSVLVEEVGEVSKALNEFELGNITFDQLQAELKKELSQVASVASLWWDSEQEMQEAKKLDDEFNNQIKNTRSDF